MGLDVSHDCFHGAYGAFQRLRLAIAEAAGIGVLQVSQGTYVRPAMDLPWERFEEKNFFGEWDTAPDDPLYVLLIHSDCEGRIPHEYAGHLATRLEQIIPALPTTGEGHLSVGVQAAAQKFAAGLRHASENHEDVEFY